MKVRLLIFFCCCLNNLIAQNISGKIEYTKGIVSLEENDPNNSKSSYTYQRLKELESGFSELTYVLEFNNNEALFYHEEIISFDEGPWLRLVLSVGKGKGVYYSNISTGTKTHQLEAFGGSQFLITSNVSDIKWKLHNETKKIGDYVCYKASTTYVVKNNTGTFNHPVTVWYAPEIPVGFGPVGYGGLPGVIVELTVQYVKYTVSKVTLNPKKKIEIKKPTKGKLVTEEEFNDIGKEAMGNFKRKISN